MTRSRDVWIGVDLGGTKILAGAFSARGASDASAGVPKWLGRDKRPTPFEGSGHDLVEAIVESIRGALSSASIPEGRIAAIGIGSPGPLDPERGLLLRTPHIKARRIPLGPGVERAFGRRVVIDNDVHMALRAEWRRGAARGCRDVVALWIGTGVGGGVISGGRLVTGVNRNAGELGHMIVDARRAREGTDRGSLEWEASKTGLVRWLKKKISGGRHSKLAKAVRKKGRLHSSALGDAFRDGDALAVEAVERSARYVGIAIANLFDALAPEVFVLGGGVVEDVGAPYVRIARKTALAFSYSTDLARPRVVASMLGDEAGPLGAAIAAREAFSQAARS